MKFKKGKEKKNKPRPYEANFSIPCWGFGSRKIRPHEDALMNQRVPNVKV